MSVRIIEFVFFRITSIEPRVSVGGFVGISLNSNLSFISCENNAIVIGGTSCVSAISLSSLAIILSLGATLTLKKKN